MHTGLHINLQNLSLPDFKHRLHVDERPKAGEIISILLRKRPELPQAVFSALRFVPKKVFLLALIG